MFNIDLIKCLYYLFPLQLNIVPSSPTSTPTHKSSPILLSSSVLRRGSQTLVCQYPPSALHIKSLWDKDNHLLPLRPDKVNHLGARDRSNAHLPHMYRGLGSVYSHSLICGSVSGSSQVSGLCCGLMLTAYGLPVSLVPQLFLHISTSLSIGCCMEPLSL